LFGVALVFLCGGILGNLLGLGNAKNRKDAGGEKHTNQIKQNQMKTQKAFLLIAPATVNAQAANHIPSLNSGYVWGGIVALFVLAYLVYTLIRPEKF
jgi:K+-transporting ATPase KdpF subunit